MDHRYLLLFWRSTPTTNGVGLEGQLVGEGGLVRPALEPVAQKGTETSCRPPHDELSRNRDMAHHSGAQLLNQALREQASGERSRLTHRRERRVAMGCNRHVVVA